MFIIQFLKRITFFCYFFAGFLAQWVGTSSKKSNGLRTSLAPQKTLLAIFLPSTPLEQVLCLSRQNKFASKAKN